MNTTPDLRILLVENDPNWQGQLEEKLQLVLKNISKTGYIRIISSFDKAREAMRQDGPWHLLVTDIGLADSVLTKRSGEKLGRHLAELAYIMQIPCIVVSGTPTLVPTDVRTFLKQYGAKDFISKADFTGEQFMKSVREALADLAAKDVDLVILTVLPEEYQAVQKRLSNPQLVRPTESYPDLYAWTRGEISSATGTESRSAVVGMTGQAGNVAAALAASEAITRWRPRYFFFVGIAGGFELDGLQKGDVVIAEVIHGYEYGKVEKEFLPRDQWTFTADQGLINNAMRFAVSSDGWKEKLQVERPAMPGILPKVIKGQIASGEKVVDDPTNEFFVQIQKKWPKLLAVEMEGAGAASAIEQARSRGLLIRFLMIRGISDMPTANTGNLNRGTRERDAWKTYAANAAAAFTLSFIAEGLPLRPERSTE
jgi:nucleoside phosphorylase